MHANDELGAIFWREDDPMECSTSRGEHAGMEGNGPGPPALPTLEQLTEEPASKPVAWSLRHSGLPVCALLALQRT